MTPQLHPFYPIVPDLGWVERLLPLGVKTVQLRIKNLPMEEVRRQIEGSLALAKHFGATLIVNDFWQEAIKLGASYIHLGQEDLADADLAAIRKAGLKLGVSTHSHEELEAALEATPDYVALGPIWETTLKKMKWAPQGLDRLREWVSRTDVPVVAIGGITLERAPAVFDTGAASIAVVTDIVMNKEPEVRAKAWLDLTNN